MEVIKDAVAGVGHFLGHDNTLGLMESEYVYPKLADRQSIKDWQESGSVDIRERGRKALTAIMQNHYPQLLDSADDARIREAFDIRLRPRDMKPGNERW